MSSRVPCRQRIIDHGEVFTPPKLVSAMLDLLPQDLFCRSDTTFLDPVCKIGVFLREIARRLNAGMRDQMPDKQARVDHILTRQVFGLATSELTAAHRHQVHHISWVTSVCPRPGIRLRSVRMPNGVSG